MRDLSRNLFCNVKPNDKGINQRTNRYGASFIHIKGIDAKK